MIIKTYIPRFSIDRGEYSQETQTADTLKGYTSDNMYFKKELKLFAIGGNAEDKYTTNWDIYADNKGTLYSIARPGSGCGSTYFGDCDHIRHLIRQGHFGDTLTEYGKQLMEA